MDYSSIVTPLTAFAQFSKSTIVPPASVNGAPVSCLDLVLEKDGNKVIKSVRYLDHKGQFLASSENGITPSRMLEFLTSGLKVTDHAIVVIYFANGVVLAIVSLDNSVRANLAGHQIYRRTREFNTLFKQLIAENNVTHLALTEAHRPAFEGRLFNADEELLKPVLTWEELQTALFEGIAVSQNVMETNNNDEVSFGVMVVQVAPSVPVKLTGVRLAGAGCVLMEIEDFRVLVCHAPLVFNTSDPKNKLAPFIGAIKQYGPSVICGDMNSIDNGPNSAMAAYKAAFGDYLLALGPWTFAANFFDTVTDELPKLTISMVESHSGVIIRS
jgi:hypothetical protein